MTEHDTQKAIIDLIRLKGGIATRVNSGSMISKRNDRTYCVQLADKGTSDIIALYKGVYLAIEVKFGEGKLKPEQEAFLKSVAESGGVGLVAYDINFVRIILDEIEDAVIKSLRTKDAINFYGTQFGKNRFYSKDMTAIQAVREVRE